MRYLQLCPSAPQAPSSPAAQPHPVDQDLQDCHLPHLSPVLLLIPLILVHPSLQGSREDLDFLLALLDRSFLLVLATLVFQLSLPPLSVQEALVLPITFCIDGKIYIQ